MNFLISIDLAHLGKNGETSFGKIGINSTPPRPCLL